MLTVPHQTEGYRELRYIKGEVYFFMVTVALFVTLASKNYPKTFLSEPSLQLEDLCRLP